MVEQRPPKPKVGCSIRLTPAMPRITMVYVHITLMAMAACNAAGLFIWVGIQTVKEADCKSVTSETLLVRIQPGPPFSIRLIHGSSYIVDNATEVSLFMQSKFLKLLEEIELCRISGFVRMSLHTALSIPDICATAKNVCPTRRVYGLY